VKRRDFITLIGGDLGGNIPSKARRGQQPLAVLVKGEIAHWTPIIKAANVRAE
jgi:hypothetical protein